MKSRLLASKNKYASHKTTPLGDDSDYVEETNGWVLNPNRREGDHNDVPLEELNPDLFKDEPEALYTKLAMQSLYNLESVTVGGLEFILNGNFILPDTKQIRMERATSPNSESVSELKITLQRWLNENGRLFISPEQADFTKVLERLGYEIKHAEVLGTTFPFIGEQKKLASKMLRAAQQFDPIPQNPARDAAFQELADAQRGVPEAMMLEAQHHDLGAGVHTSVLEHTGDLTWRMADRFGWQGGQPGACKDKVTKVLRWMKHSYGFEREMNENLRNNFRYRQQHGDIPADKTYEELEAEHYAIWDKYAQAHAELKVYNHEQETARDAAVALGRRDFAGCMARLEELAQDLEKGWNYWIVVAGEFTPRKTASLNHLPAGMSVVEQATTGDFELYLVTAQDDPQWFELAFQQRGRDASDPAQQQDSVPSKVIRPKELKSLLDRWLSKYPLIHVMSHNTEYLENYRRLLQMAGFELTPDKTVEGMQAFAIQKHGDSHERA